MTNQRYPMYLAGDWVESDDTLDVSQSVRRQTVGTTFLASARPDSTRDRRRRGGLPGHSRTMPTYDRVDLLKAIAGEAARSGGTRSPGSIALEAGKPIARPTSRPTAASSPSRRPPRRRSGSRAR